MLESDRAKIDAEIVALLARGDTQSAAAKTLSAYGSQLESFVFAMLRDNEATEEAFAQFSEDLMKAIERFRGDCQFRTFVYQLAHNAALRTVKDPFRRRGRPLGTEEMAGLASPEREPTRPYLKTTMKEELQRLRSSLSAEDQMLLVLRIDQRMSWVDVARVLSTPETPAAAAALRKRFERLKERLRTLAEAEGLLRGEPSR